jgi:hypothetical protein
MGIGFRVRVRVRARVRARVWRISRAASDSGAP